MAIVAKTIIKIDVTQRKCFVFFCDGDLVESVLSVMKNIDVSGMEYCDAITYGSPSGDSLVFFGEKIDMSIIAHELIHVIHDVSLPIGIGVGPDAEEYYAYLNQYLTKKILKFIQKNDKIIDFRLV